MLEDLKDKLRAAFLKEQGSPLGAYIANELTELVISVIKEHGECIHTIALENEYCTCGAVRARDDDSIFIR